ncbi:hypothetical protein PENSPDRAFT_684541 [Peniophora sp. CONT]|nr:hypothetical protein PENSPDRAFT_684541 [Peniophora sp. CONT]
MNAAILRTSRAVRAARIPTQTLVKSRKMSSGGHGNYNPLPINPNNVRALKFKLYGYMGFGFLLPFIASGYQLWKGGAFNAPN